MTARCRRSALLLGGFLLALLLQLPGGVAHAQEPTCQRRELDSGAYTVRLCIEEPANGSRVAGDLPVTASVEIEGDAPTIVTVTFLLDGEYLLSDTDPPYSFVLPTHLFSNGLHQLDVEVEMRDDTIIEGRRIGLEIQNEASDVPPPFPTVALPFESDTAPDEDGFVVAAVGDGAGGRPTADEIVTLIESWDPDLFLYLGDVYQEGSLVEFYNWYHPAFGRFRDITYPTVGNHEYRLDGAAAYFDYWGQIPSYYSFDVAGWHFMSLNSNCDRVGGCDRDSAQYQWLARDLEQPARCALAYAHHAVFAVGPNEGTDAMRPLWRRLAQAQVSLVLTAHDHNYQRWAPLDGGGEPDDDGMTQFVVGSGGHSLYEFKEEDERLEAGFDDTFGALRLELHPDEAHYQFFDAEGEVRDEGAIRCQGPHSPPSAAEGASQPGLDTREATPTALASVVGADAGSGGVDAAIFDFDSSGTGATGGRAPLVILVALVLLTIASFAILVRRSRRGPTGEAEGGDRD